MKKLSLILFSIIILFSFSNSLLFAEKKLIVGPAIVIDGDTIKIKGKKIRLSGIDAPELKQICKRKNGKPWRCGVSAKMHLEDLIYNKQSKPIVACEYDSLDRYGRILSECGALSGIMVFTGSAVAYKRYATDSLLNLEKIAKKEKKGLWSGTFEYPEDWRRKNK